MIKFTEERLEQAIIELLGKEGCVHGIGDLKQINPGLSNDNYG